MKLLATFPIGKYKGKTLKEVIDIDKKYVLWYIAKNEINMHQEVEQYLYERDNPDF